MDIRIGYGEDIHPLVAGRPLILAGVTIPFARGLSGHSDADVVYHALSDALLGAVAAGDIGQHFPSADPLTEGIDSARIVRHCFAQVRHLGYAVNNVDVSIACERPRLAPYLLEMRARIASLLSLPEERVSVKAMTNEGFDAVGSGQAIAAKAVVLIAKE